MNIIRLYKLHKILLNVLTEKEENLINQIIYYFSFNKNNYKKIDLIFNNLIVENFSKDNIKSILFHLNMLEISYYKQSNEYYFSNSGETVLIFNINYKSFTFIQNYYKKLFKFNKKLLTKYCKIEIKSYEHSH